MHKNVTTRWLSLEVGVEKSYFLSESEKQPSFRKLHKKIQQQPQRNLFIVLSVSSSHIYKI